MRRKTTRDILRSAEGCVLVIDEAYALCSATGINNGSDPYGTGVINTLVEQIQARPGDDRAVILLGYEKEMTEMMKNVNKGLSRRFQLENAFQFPDFSDEDLVKVLMQKAKGKDLELTIGTAKRAVRKLAKARAKPNFGNAGAVDYLLAQAVEYKQARPGAGASSTLEPADFGVEADGPQRSLDSLFDGLVGLRISASWKKYVMSFHLRGRKDTTLPTASTITFCFLGIPARERPQWHDSWAACTTVLVCCHATTCIKSRPRILIQGTWDRLV